TVRNSSRPGVSSKKSVGAFHSVMEATVLFWCFVERIQRSAANAINAQVAAANQRFQRRGTDVFRAHVVANSGIHCCSSRRRPAKRRRSNSSGELLSLGPELE